MRAASPTEIRTRSKTEPSSRSRVSVAVPVLRAMTPTDPAEVVPGGQGASSSPGAAVALTEVVVPVLDVVAVVQVREDPVTASTVGSEERAVTAGNAPSGCTEMLVDAPTMMG